MKSIQKEVTNKIIQSLENGVKPWDCPWMMPVPYRSLPFNIHSEKSYSGINCLMLWLARLDQDYGTNGWLTFRQIKATGGLVRKGEHGWPCLYYEYKKVEDEESGKIKVISFVKRYVVFNLDQIEGGNYALPDIAKFDINDKAEQVLKATGAIVREHGLQAKYSVSNDLITMPPKAAFKSLESYYATLFHELIHWTLHESRLDLREKIKKYDNEYAFEELVAELGSAFVCAELGIIGNYANHASYIDSWLKLLKNNDKAIFAAASLASKAHRYILPEKIC